MDKNRQQKLTKTGKWAKMGKNLTKNWNVGKLIGGHR